MDRPLLVFGKAEADVVQIFSGLIVKAPPGWAIWLKPPANAGASLPYRVGDCILEDWLTVPLFLNIRLLRVDESCQIRRSHGPVAQLVAIPRETYEASWRYEIQDVVPEEVETFVQSYDDRKLSTHPKNSRSYYQQRALSRLGADRPPSNLTETDPG
jgi:hypothetical protein